MAQDDGGARPLEARSGRDLQRWDGGTRLVGLCVAHRGGRVLLVRGLKRGDWIFPKGGWEADETAAQAAEREAMEEGGVVRDAGSDLVPLGRVDFLSGKGNPTRAHAFAMRAAAALLAEWPERGVRERRWFAAADVAAALERDEAREVWRLALGSGALGAGQ